MAKNILITPNTLDPSNNPRIDFTGASTGSIRLEVLSDGALSFMGNNGALFGISDDASGSLMSVNNISGLPIIYLDKWEDLGVLTNKFVNQQLSKISMCFYAQFL